MGFGNQVILRDKPLARGRSFRPSPLPGRIGMRSKKRIAR